MKRGVQALGVQAAEVVLFLGFVPYIAAQLVRLHACMYASVWDVFIYLFFTLLCNAGCDLGNNISQRDVGRELCDHFNLCVILDCTATSHRHNTINSAFFFPAVFNSKKR